MERKPRKTNTNEPFEDVDLFDMYSIAKPNKKDEKIDIETDTDVSDSDDSDLIQLAQKVAVVDEDKDRAYDRKTNYAITRKLIGESQIPSNMSQYPDLFSSYVQIQMKWVVDENQLKKYGLKPLEYDFRLKAIQNHIKKCVSIQQLCTMLSLKKTKQITEITKLGYIQFIMMADASTRNFRGYQGPIYFRYYVLNNQFWINVMCEDSQYKGYSFGSLNGAMQLMKKIPQLYEIFQKHQIFRQKFINPFVLFALREDYTDGQKFKLIPDLE